MTDSTTRQFAAATSFATARVGCFALPNRGTQHRCLSAAPRICGAANFVSWLAFSRALPDGVTAVTRDAMLAHIAKWSRQHRCLQRRLQNGYADEPRASRRRDTLHRRGIAGLSIETPPEIRGAALRNEPGHRTHHRPRNAVDVSAYR